ncbi:MAG: DEAD/DEAH box helicase [Acidobacteria bacterium]|nr:DEAD/DEAH box helicase [Acidobacteriota bacterium]
MGRGGVPRQGQVTSSLFSSNPTAVTKFDEEVEEVEDAKPSNAPLDADSFQGLGLSDRLVTELAKLKLDKPTAIQKKTIPLMCNTTNDAFLQAETGSGKTLAYVLPMLHRVLALSQNHKISRDSGIFGIVMTPTRELAKQVYNVMCELLKHTPWLVASAVIGGESKKAEKARIRKGVNFLIATPGRLSDHLQNTQVLKLSTVRWLVLDEGDRLMELGFEDDIQKVITQLGKAEVATTTYDGAPLDQLPDRRITVLCSATMKMSVQKLGDMSLKDAVHIEAAKDEGAVVEEGDEDKQVAFTAPSQLKQTYIVSPAKLRLVTLVSYLKFAFARKGSVMKAIVFISCADSVDFHFELLKSPMKEKAATGDVKGKAATGDAKDKAATEDAKDKATTEDANDPKDVKDAEDAKNAKDTKGAKAKAAKGAKDAKDAKDLTSTTVGPAAYITSAANRDIKLHRLHGSLSQPIRTATLKSFSESKDPAVLITTDIASRGLDIPSVDLVMELDPAFSVEDHIHRIGRTARAGRPGKAVILLLPGSEEGYVSLLKSKSAAPSPQSYDAVLQQGLSIPLELPVATHAKVEEGRSYTEKAEQLQLHFEQRLLDDRRRLELGRNGFKSHVRAYATHVKEERCYFDMTALHLGHVAKSFCLREAPGGIGNGIDRKAAKVGRSKRGREEARDREDRRDMAENGGELPGAREAFLRSARMANTGITEFNLG